MIAQLIMHFAHLCVYVFRCGDGVDALVEIALHYLQSGRIAAELSREPQHQGHYMVASLGSTSKTPGTT
jgi:hypothetical protein